MTFRELRKDEWDRLAGILSAEFDQQLPDPSSSLIVVAEDGGEIVGLLVAQLLLHTEPLWVRPSHRGKIIIPHLVECLRRLIPDAGYAFATTTNGKVSRLLERLGFKRQEFVTYRWVGGVLR